jgi:zinc protease
VTRVLPESSFVFGPGLAGSTYRLDNGLRVHVVPDRSAPVVAFQSWFAVGSRHEGRGKTGLAHLLEHLMFGATRHHALGEFDRLMEEAGADVNAATWADWTFYYENLPRDAFPLALELEADRMRSLVIGKREVETEKEVVENERRMRVDDDVDGAAEEALWSLAFGEHPYGHPTIGWLEDIRAFSAADCLAFYQAHYAPNAATLVVVGDVDPADTISMIRRHYGRFRDRVRPAEPRAARHVQRRERRRSLTLPTAAPRVEVAYRAVSARDPRFPAVSLLAELLFGGRSAPLVDGLVHRDELCLSVRGGSHAFQLDGLFEVSLTCRPEVSTTDALAAFDRRLAATLARGFRPVELVRARNRIEYQTLSGFETALGKAESIGFHDTVLGVPNGAFAMLEAQRRLEPRALVELAAELFDPRRRSMVLVERRADA